MALSAWKGRTAQPSLLRAQPQKEAHRPPRLYLLSISLLQFFLSPLLLWRLQSQRTIRPRQGRSAGRRPIPIIITDTATHTDRISHPCPSRLSTLHRARPRSGQAHSSVQCPCSTRPRLNWTRRSARQLLVSASAFMGSDLESDLEVGGEGRRLEKGRRGGGHNPTDRLYRGCLRTVR